MTSEDKRIMIRDELSRATETLRAAEVLAANNLMSDAVSRLYYFVFHVARAALLAKGLQPQSHEGILRLIGLHFVKANLLPPHDAHILTRLMKYRHEADYNSSYVFTGRDFEEMRRDET